MDPQQHEQQQRQREELIQQSVDVTLDRVAQILGSDQVGATAVGTAPGAAAPAPEAAAAPATAAPRTRARRGTRTSARKPNGVTSGSGAAADAWPSVNIALPPEIHEWFKQRAAQAEFEPTLSKYLQWVLRRVAKKQQQEAEAEAEAEAGRIVSTVEVMAQEA